MVLAERKVIDKLKYVIAQKNCLLLSADIHLQVDSEKLLNNQNFKKGWQKSFFIYSQWYAN